LSLVPEIGGTGLLGNETHPADYVTNTLNESRAEAQRAILLITLL
jgi:hypothetical protein